MAGALERFWGKGRGRWWKGGIWVERGELLAFFASKPALRDWMIACGHACVHVCVCAHTIAYLPSAALRAAALSPWLFLSFARPPFLSSLPPFPLMLSVFWERSTHGGGAHIGHVTRGNRLSGLLQLFNPAEMWLSGLLSLRLCGLIPRSLGLFPRSLKLFPRLWNSFRVF